MDQQITLQKVQTSDDAILILLFQWCWMELRRRNRERDVMFLIQDSVPKANKQTKYRWDDQDLLFGMEPREATVFITSCGHFWAMHLVFKFVLYACGVRSKPYLNFIRQWAYVLIVSTWFVLYFHPLSFVVVVPILCWIAGLFHLTITNHYEIDGLFSIGVLGGLSFVLSTSPYVIQTLVSSFVLGVVGVRPNAYNINLGSLQSFCLSVYTIYTSVKNLTSKYDGTLTIFLLATGIVLSFLPWARPAESLSKEDTWLMWILRYVSTIYYTWLIGSNVIRIVTHEVAEKGELVFEAMRSVHN
jgi:hypothetical protein